MRFSIHPGALVRQLKRATTDGDVSSLPAFPATGEPPVVNLATDAITAWALFQFTPPDTSAEIGWTDVPSAEGGTAVTFRGGSIASIRHILMWAQRKAGATGSIAANTAILKGDNSGYTEIGRITIGASTSGEPASDILSIIRQGTNEAWLSNISSSPFHVDMTSADPDLEICLLILGVAA